MQDEKWVRQRQRQRRRSSLTGHQSSVITSTSLDLRTGFLHDAAPLCHLALEKCRQLGGRRSDRLYHLRAQPFPHVRHLDRARDLQLDFFDDGSWRLRRRERGVPSGRLVAWKPGLGDGRQLRQYAYTLRRRHCERDEPAGTYAGQRRRGTEGELELPRNEIDDDSAAAFVGHVHHFYAGNLLEQLASQMLRRSAAGGPVEQSSRFRLRERDQLLDGSRRDRRITTTMFGTSAMSDTGEKSATGS